MFTLVLLLEDKGSHQYVLPPIGPQDIECGEGEATAGFVAGKTRRGNGVADTSVPRSQTNRLIKHKPHRELSGCSCVSGYVDARVSTPHLSRPRSEREPRHLQVKFGI